jgi:hypothetical protein
VHVADGWYPFLENLFGLWRGENHTAPSRTDLPVRPVPSGAGPRSQRRPHPRPTRGRGQRAARPPRVCVGDGKRARGKPIQDPHPAGSGYTATGRPTPTGAGQRRRGNAPTQDTSLTRFLNG